MTLHEHRTSRWILSQAIPYRSKKAKIGNNRLDDEKCLRAHLKTQLILLATRRARKESRKASSRSDLSKWSRGMYRLTRKEESTRPSLNIRQRGWTRGTKWFKLVRRYNNDNSRDFDTVAYMGCGGGPYVDEDSYSPSWGGQSQ
jgi:hypothetical protein